MKLLYILLGIALVLCRYIARRWWQLRLKQQNSRRASSRSKAPLPELPHRRSAARSEAAKDAEAEYTAKHLQQHLPVGPQYLSREELIQQVKPSDAEMALCSLYSNRYYTQKRLNRASKKLGIPELIVYDQFEDRRVGLRFCTFVTRAQDLGRGVKVAAAVFAVRGTRLTKTGTVQADIQLLRDRDAELYYAQRALKHVQKHIRRLSAEQPDVQWGFFITGHSLGGFAAATCLILCDRILTCTAFESPGLTTFYHRLAAQQGDEAYWRERITNYLAIPNPINMCQKHLGRIVRVHFPRLECRTDATHVVRCALGTGVRALNWCLAASVGFSALCLAAGISRSALICRMLEAWASECVLEMAAPPVAASAYWTLQSAAALVATQLGTTLRYIMQQHSMWHMAQAFDPVSGEPKRCVEMEGWPRMERMMDTFGATVSRALLESFYATPSTEGLSVIFNRTSMVEARIRRLPGYAPMPDFDDGASEGGAFLWRLGDAFELWDDQGDALDDEEAERDRQPAETPAEEPSRAELVSPRRSRRSMHSPARPLDVPPAQTGYDSDDEGEGEPGTTEAEELESAAEPLPPPRAWAARLPGEGSPDEEGSAGLDAPGPRLLDSYDTDPGGADTERRARRRALRRSIARGAGGHSALRAASSLMDSLCKALGGMPDDVERAAAFGDHWGSDGFEVSGLDPTESEPDRAGSSMAAQHSAARSSRLLRNRPLPFECDSTSGTDACETRRAYRPAQHGAAYMRGGYRAAARHVHAQQPPLQQSPHVHGPGQDMARPADGPPRPASMLLPSLQEAGGPVSLSRQPSTSSGSGHAGGSIAGSVTTMPERSTVKAASTKDHRSCRPTLNTSKQVGSVALAMSQDREGSSMLEPGGLGAADQERNSPCDAVSPAVSSQQPEGPQGLGRWFWTPCMWAGVKRGIRRRAAQVQS